MVTVRTRRSDHLIPMKRVSCRASRRRSRRNWGYLWGERGTVVVGVPVGEGQAIEAGGAFDEWQSDRGYDENAEKRHLETGGEELTGIEYEQP